MLCALMPSFQISVSGLEAEHLRMKVAAHNLANVHTTRDVDGNPFRRRIIILEAQEYHPSTRNAELPSGGVKVKEILQQSSDPILQYNPDHPDAGPDGYVRFPNISPLLESIDMMTASRAYEANLSAMRQAKRMAQNLIDLLKV